MYFLLAHEKVNEDKSLRILTYVEIRADMFIRHKLNKIDPGRVIRLG